MPGSSGVSGHEVGPVLTLGAPLGLLALAGVPALIALYFLRKRSSPRLVSAAFLWRATREINEAGPKWRRLHREASLLLELGAVLLAAAFLADARCAGGPGEAAHVVVVVDGGFSLQARGSDGVSVADQVRAEAKRWLDAGGGVATVVESGTRPRLLAGPGAPLDDARKALDSWDPTGPGHDPRAAWRLARELAGPGARMVFLTDAVPSIDVPKELELVALGATRPNVAFAGATRVDGADGTRVELRVASFGGGPARVPVELRDDRGELVHREEVAVPAKGSGVLSVTLPATGALEVTLPDDALPADGRLLLVPDRRRPIRARNLLDPSSAAGAAVARFLAAAPDVELAGPPDLVFAPPGARPPGTWVATLGTTAPDATALRSFVGPFFAERDHPVLADARFDGVVWTAGPNPPGRAVLSAGTRTLLADEGGGRFQFNLELGRSNLHRSLAWPLLLGNLLTLRRASLPGFVRRNVAVGEALAFSTGDEGIWTLSGPGGARPIATGTLSLASERTGLYELLRDGEVQDRLSVGAIDVAESDLSGRGSGRRAATGRSGERANTLPERAAWPLALALLLLLADYALAAPGVRRLGVRP